jgi:hypothetical protein
MRDDQESVSLLHHAVDLGRKAKSVPSEIALKATRGRADRVKMASWLAATMTKCPWNSVP